LIGQLSHGEKFLSKMRQGELNRILAQCQEKLPFEYERLARVHTDRSVLFDLLADFPLEIGPILRDFFLQSPEYQQAIDYIKSLLDQ